MLGPVSGTGRAMMASLQQAIQKGMPPDQAIQYVKSMATQGVAPLTDLYAMMNQFQRMKQQPVQAPQTPPTIRDQLNMAEQQQAQQQMAMQQQAQQQMAMQQGLGGMPAPAMEQAQFAGGGIVAFNGEDGSLVGRAYYENLDPLRSSEEDREVARIMRKSPYELTSQDIALLKEKGFEFSQSEPPSEDGIIGRANRALSGLREPYFRGKSATLSDEDLAKVGGAGAINEKVYRAFGGNRYVAPTATKTAAPAPVATKPSSVSASPANINPFSQVENAERQALDFMESARSRPEAVNAREERRSTAISTAPTAAAPAQLTREEMENQEYERIQAFRKREGLGGASEKMQQFLTDEGSKLDKQFGEDRMLAFAEAGFKMAAAASRPGATFLGAFSEGAISGTQALRGLQKEMNANRRGLKESMLKLEEAKELRKEGDFKTAMQQAQQARSEMFDLKRHADAMAMDERKIQVMIRGQDIDAQTAAARAAQGSGLTAGDAFRGRLGVLEDRIKAAREVITDYQKARGMQMPETPQGKAAYNKAVNEVNSYESMRGQLAGLPYSGGPVANTSAPPSDIAALIELYKGR